MTLTIVYAQTPFPTTVQRTLFLAGPTDRRGRPTAWRQEALQILRDLDFDGHVFIPEAEGNVWNGDRRAQFEWEHAALQRADAIVLWVPRDLDTLPGFTTNIEFGLYARSGKMVVGAPEGAPEGAPKMDWIVRYSAAFGVPYTNDLKYAIDVARAHIGLEVIREAARKNAPVVYPKPDLTADCVVVNEGDVLLIQRRKDPFKGQWALPGGYINKGEKSRAAAARELLEETSLVVQDLDLKYVGVYDDPGRDPRGWVVSHAYCCVDSTSRDIMANDDAAEARWFPMAEAEAMPLAFDHNRILTDALDSLDSVK